MPSFPITKERMNEIYTILNSCMVCVKEAPRSGFADYFCESSAELAKCDQAVNDFFREICWAYSEVDDLLRRSDMLFKESVEEALFDPEIQQIEGTVSLEERKAKARFIVERKRKQATTPEGGELPEGYMSWTEELLELKGLREWCRQLKEVLKDHGRTLKNTQQELRAQKDAIESEIRMLQGGGRSAGRPSGKRVRDGAVLDPALLPGPPQGESEWNELSDTPTEENNSDPIDQGVAQ